MSEAGEDAVRVEAEGETVGEAKWVALRELERLAPGLDKAAVRFQVVTEGERGLLGVGYTPARVVAVVDRPASVARAAEPAAKEPEPEPEPERGDLSDDAAAARDLLRRIVDGIGVECRIDAREDDEAISVTCSGADLGLLIGKHGQTIDAIQYLVNAIVFRDRFGSERKDVVVDAAGYRDRRRAALDAVAVRSAERALREGTAVRLEPMTAVERKMVHVRLKDYPGVVTSSEGTEPNRYVVVSPGSND